MDNLFILIAAFFAFIGPAMSATPVLQTQEGAVVHWTKPFLDVGLDPQAPSRSIPVGGVSKSLQLAISAWNQARAGQPQLYFKEQGPFDITIGFCRTRWSGGNLDLGHSEFSADPRTGVVRTATVEVNECDQAFFAPDERPDRKHSLVSVLTHELGHALGLGHAETPESVMFPTGGGVSSRDPQPDDTAALAVIYLGRFPQSPQEPTRGPPTLVPIAKSTKAHALPEKSTQLMTIKIRDGREMVVYTGEAIILPPLGESGGKRDKKAPSAKRRPKRGH